MKEKNNKRVLSPIFILASLLIMATMVSFHSVVVNAEEAELPGVFSSEDSYSMKEFLTLNEDGDLSWTDGPQISVKNDNENKGLMISGQADDLNQTTFLITKQFNFDGNAVSRVNVDALAGVGTNVTINLFLDNETSPFASFSIYKQGRNIWTKHAYLNKDLRNRNITGIHKVSFTLNAKNAGAATVLLRSIEFVQNSIPTLYVNIDESVQTVQAMYNSKNASVKCFGSMNLMTNDSSNSFELDYIKGYGGSNFWKGLDKKQLILKLENPASLLGMQNCSYWTLACQRLDNTRVKNAISYDFAKKIGMAYVPESKPVELLLNGTYFGMYYLTESMINDENPCEFDQTMSADEMEDADSLDMNSTVDYFWLQQVFHNDSAFSSDDTYLYEKDEKIGWGPIGDFSIASWDELSEEDFNTSNNSLITQLRSDPSFVEKLKERWEVIYPEIKAYYQDGGKIDQYYESLSIALEYDLDKWGLEIPDNNEDDFELGQDIYTDENTLELFSMDDEDEEEQQVTLADLANNLKSYLQKRAEWINQNLDRLAPEEYTLTFMVDGEEYDTLKVVAGDDFELPEKPSKEGYTFKGWRYYSEESKTYVMLDDQTEVNSDMTFEAYFVKDSDLVQPAELYLSSEEIWVEPGFKPYLFSSVYPANVNNLDVVVSYSDEDMLLNEDKTLSLPTDPGEYTVTFRCGSLCKTCTVHVSEDESIPVATISLKEASISLNPGQQKQIELKFNAEVHAYRTYRYLSGDSSIASVDSCGVIHAKKAGTTTIIVREAKSNQVLRCKVTVTDPSASSATTEQPKDTTANAAATENTTFVVKGLTYKITSKSVVALVKPTKKTIKSVSVPSNVKYQGVNYKVTGISAKAFYNCKKLKKITLGKNIKSIGNNAFKNINKRATFKVPSGKKKAYKKLLTSKKGFRRTMKVK